MNIKRFRDDREGARRAGNRSEEACSYMADKKEAVKTDTENFVRICSASPMPNRPGEPLSVDVVPRRRGQNRAAFSALQIHLALTSEFRPVSEFNTHCSCGRGFTIGNENEHREEVRSSGTRRRGGTYVTLVQGAHIRAQ